MVQVSLILSETVHPVYPKVHHLLSQSFLAKGVGSGEWGVNVVVLQSTIHCHCHCYGDSGSRSLGCTFFVVVRLAFVVGRL